MSILIDQLIKQDFSSTSQAKDLNWYIAKPISLYSMKTMIYRIKNALRVIKGKSFAVHYKDDES
jgi:hypothetical protein